MKKNMKKVLGIAAVLSMLSGCSTQLVVTPTDSLVVEYGSELEHESLFDAAQSDEGVKVSTINGFDGMKIGTQEVSVVFTDAEAKKEVEAFVNVTVEDTKKPVIKLAKEEVTITEGDELDLQYLVQKISDSVDGVLKYSKNKDEADAWHFETGKLDTKKAGTYTVKVVAVDKNKNSSEAKIKVIVKEKPEPVVEQPVVQEPVVQAPVVEQPVVQEPVVQEPVVEQPVVQEPVVQEPVVEQPVVQEPVVEEPKKEEHTCKADGQWTTLGNSGVAFYDYEDAYNYSLEQAPENHGAAITDTYDICGNEGWTIEWYELDFD